MLRPRFAFSEMHGHRCGLATEAVNPLLDQGQKLVPSVTRTFTASRPLFVFLQAYERDATTQRPLVAFVTFYLDGVKTFETEPLAVADGWNPNSKAVPIRFSIPLESLKPGTYDCHVTVLDPGVHERPSGEPRS
jgi:hypothetical protein